MSDYDEEALVPIGDGEEGRVEAWRWWRFLQLGVDDVDLAHALALSPVDLHEFERLLEKGCPAGTAVLILQPV